mgnify:CR=1 FL=1
MSIYSIKTAITLKATLTVTDNPSYLGSMFVTMSEVASTSMLLVQNNKGIVDVFNISNLNIVTKDVVFYLDGGNPANSSYDGLYSFKASTKFFISKLHTSFYSM